MKNKPLTLFMLVLLLFSSFSIAINVQSSNTKGNSTEPVTNGLESSSDPENQTGDDDFLNDINMTEQQLQDEIGTFPSKLSSNLIPEDVSTPITVNNVIDEAHSDGRDSYIIDFGYELLIPVETATNVVYDGIFGYVDIQAYLDVTFDLTIPVNMTLDYNSTATAGRTFTVNATLYDAGDITFSVDINLGLRGQIGIGPNILGLRSLNDYDFNFQHSFLIYEGAIPYDPLPLLDWQQKIRLDSLVSSGFNAVVPGLGSAMSSLFNLDLVLTPQLDADIIADVYTDDPENNQPLQMRFETLETKSFSVKTDELTLNNSNFEFGLTNFEMKFEVSLLWSLHFEFDGILSILNKIFRNGFTWDMFTFPRLELPGGLPDALPRAFTGGISNVQTDSSATPEYIISSYSLTEPNSNGILDPDETASVTLDLVNVGSGGVLNANISYLSSDFTITTPINQLGTQIGKEDTVSATVDFTVPSSYINRNGNISITIDSLTPAGEIVTRSLSINLRVLQPSTAFLNPVTFDIVTNDGDWDAGEEVTLDIALDSVGSNIDYVEVGIDSVSAADFTSSNSWDSISAIQSSYTFDTITLTSPSNIQDLFLDIQIYIYYEDASNTDVFLEFYIFTVEMSPLSPEIQLDDIFVNSIGNDNGDEFFDAAESYTLTGNITNIGTDVADEVYAYLFTNDTDIFVEEAFFVWYNLGIDQDSLSLNDIYFEISPFIGDKTVIFTYWIFTWTWYGELVFKEYTFEVEFQSYSAPSIDVFYSTEIPAVPSTSESLLPGELTKFNFELELDDGAFLNAEAHLTTNTTGIEIVNGTHYFGTEVGFNSNDFISSTDMWVYTAGNFAGGDVFFQYNLTYTKLDGTVISEYYLVVIENVQSGDLVLPSASQVVSTDTCSEPGEEVIIDITFSDNIGIDIVYFFYFNDSSNNWEILEFPDINALEATLEVTLITSDQTFNYGYAVLDLAGNLAIFGDDPGYTIDTCGDDPVDPEPDPEDPDPTPPDDDPVNNDDQDTDEGGLSISYMIFLLSFVILPLIQRRSQNKLT